MDDSDVVCNLLHLGQKMTGKQHRHAAIFHQLTQEPAEVSRTGRIKAIGRLVENQQAGSAQLSQC